MNSSIKLVIRKEKCSRDGKHTVFLQYCYTSVKRVLISTGISIPEIYWDKSSCFVLQTLPIVYGLAEDVQEELNKKRIKAEKLIQYALRQNNCCPMQFLKRNFHLPDYWNFEQLEDKHNGLSVFYQIGRLLTGKTGMVSPATLTVIRIMKKHLLSFVFLIIIYRKKSDI